MTTQKQKKRDLILETACRVFSKNGLRKSTLEDIARELGMKNTALYHYFQSKEALILAVAEHIMVEVYETEKTILQQEKPLIDRLMAVLDYREKLTRDIIKSYAHLIEELLTMPPLFRDEIGAHLRKTIEMFKEELARDRALHPDRTLDPTAFATLFVLSAMFTHMNFFINLNHPQIICSEEALHAEFRNLIFRAFTE
jgi:AcrR family transcriptional regulator